MRLARYAAMAWCALHYALMAFSAITGWVPANTTAAAVSTMMATVVGGMAVIAEATAHFDK